MINPKIHLLRFTDLENELAVASGKGQLGSLGWTYHTAVFKMDNQQRPTVEHMELCSMLCGSLDGRGVWGRMEPVYIWLSPFAVNLKLSQHCLLTGHTQVSHTAGGFFTN